MRKTGADFMQERSRNLRQFDGLSLGGVSPQATIFVKPPVLESGSLHAPRAVERIFFKRRVACFNRLWTVQDSEGLCTRGSDCNRLYFLS